MERAYIEDAAAEVLELSVVFLGVHSFDFTQRCLLIGE